MSEQPVGLTSSILLIGAANCSFAKLAAAAFQESLSADIKSGIVRICPALTMV